MSAYWDWGGVGVGAGEESLRYLEPPVPRESPSSTSQRPDEDEPNAPSPLAGPKCPTAQHTALAAVDRPGILRVKGGWGVLASLVVARDGCWVP